MKRLAWIFIAIFCTALAQVQPLESRPAAPESCDCCERSGACEMPDCAPAPQAGQPAPMVSVVRADEVQVRRQTPARTARTEPFYAVFFAAPSARPEAIAPRQGVPVAQVPLFKAHCRFLI